MTKQTQGLAATITLCCPKNPLIGYQIRITKLGETVLFTARGPQDGSDLLTFADALRVAAYYSVGNGGVAKPRPSRCPNPRDCGDPTCNGGCGY